MLNLVLYLSPDFYQKSKNLAYIHKRVPTYRKLFKHSGNALVIDQETKPWDLHLALYNYPNRDKINVLHIIADANETQLLFPNPESEPEAIDLTKIALSLTDLPNFQLLIIEGQVHTNAITALLKQRIPAVVCTSPQPQSINTFYQEYASGNSVIKAFEKASLDIPNKHGHALQTPALKAYRWWKPFPDNTKWELHFRKDEHPLLKQSKRPIFPNLKGRQRTFVLNVLPVFVFLLLILGVMQSRRPSQAEQAYILAKSVQPNSTIEQKASKDALFIEIKPDIKYRSSIFDIQYLPKSPERIRNHQQARKIAREHNSDIIFWKQYPKNPHTIRYTSKTPIAWHKRKFNEQWAKNPYLMDFTYQGEFQGSQEEQQIWIDGLLNAKVDNYPQQYFNQLYDSTSLAIQLAYAAYSASPITSYGIYLQLKKQFPFNPTVQNNLAVLDYHKNPQKAIDTWKALSEKSTASPFININLGIAYLNQQKSDAAAKQFYLAQQRGLETLATLYLARIDEINNHFQDAAYKYKQVIYTLKKSSLHTFSLISQIKRISQPATLLYEAQLFKEQGDYKQTMVKYTQVIANASTETHIAKFIAHEMAQFNRPHTAKHLLSQVLEQDSSADLYIARANINNTLGQYEAAQKDQIAALQKSPNNPKAHFSIVESHIKQQQWQLAEQTLTTATEALEADYSNKAEVLKGLIAFHQGDFEKSKQIFARTSHPSYKTYIPDYYTAKINLQRGDTTSAVANLGKANRKAPLAYEPLFLKAILTAQITGKESAIPLLKEIREINPYHKQTHTILAEWLYQNEQYQDAIPSLTWLIQNNPHNPDLHYKRGIAYKNINASDRAYKDLEIAFKESPNNLTNCLELADILYELNLFPEAETYYNQAIKISPTNPLVYHKKGVLYYKQQQYEKAEQNFLTAIQKGDHPESYLKLTRLYIKTKQWDKGSQTIAKGKGYGTNFKSILFLIPKIPKAYQDQYRQILK